MIVDLICEECKISKYGSKWQCFAHPPPEAPIESNMYACDTFRRWLHAKYGMFQQETKEWYSEMVRLWYPELHDQILSCRVVTYPNGDIYDGDHEDGKRNGKGTMKYFIAQANKIQVAEQHEQNEQIDSLGHFSIKTIEWISYEGTWKDDMKHGNGVLRYINGGVYEGSFKNDCRHGYGSFRRLNYDGSYSFYGGVWAQDDMHGKGISGHLENVRLYRLDEQVHKLMILWRSRNNSNQARGWIYDGEFINGSKHGKGEYIESYKSYDGDKFASYKGDWVVNKEHGNGQYTWSDESTYEGEWQMGTRHGKGIFRNKCGHVYEGNWENNQYHGAGVYTKKPHGERKEGEWRNGELYNGIVINENLKEKVRTQTKI